MTYPYKESEARKMTVTLEGKRVTGKYMDVRIDPSTLPSGKEWYQIRHQDDDGSEPASMKRGCVVVNFLGTFICDPVEGMETGDEKEILEWSWDE